MFFVNAGQESKGMEISYTRFLRGRLVSPLVQVDLYVPRAGFRDRVDGVRVTDL